MPKKLRCFRPINPILMMGRRGHQVFQRISNSVCAVAGARNIGGGGPGPAPSIADFIAFGVNSAGVFKGLVKGIGSFTFARATEATVITQPDFLVETALPNELRVEYGRRVRNLYTYTEDITNIDWTKSGSSSADSATEWTVGAQYDALSQTFSTTEDEVYTLSVKLRNIDGNTSLVLLHSGSDSGDNTPITINGTQKRYSVTINGRAGGGNVVFGIQDRNASGFGTVEATEWQLELVSGKTNQNPSEYVSVGVGTGLTVTAALDDVLIIDNGTSGNWSAPVMSNSLSGLNGWPRFRFTENLIINKKYQVTGLLSGDISAINQIRLAYDGGDNNLDYDNATGVISGTATAAVAGIEFITAGSSIFSITIESLVFEECDHGVFVDGVKDFAYENGNTVASNVVTESKGAKFSILPRALYEPASTNVVSQSEAINTWTQQRTSITPNVIMSPSGTTTGDKIVEDSTIDVDRYAWQNVNNRPDGTYYFTIWVKKAERSHVAVQLILNNYGDRYTALFDLNDGSFLESRVMNAPTGTGYILGRETNGWYEFTIYGEHSGGGDVGHVVGLSDSATPDWSGLALPQYTGDGVSGLFAWGGQLEAGQKTSYIPTSGSAETRTADDGVPSFDYANWSQTEGTWYVDAWFSVINDGQNHHIFGLSNLTVAGPLRKIGEQIISQDDTGQSAVPGILSADNRYRVVTDFGTGDTLEVGRRDIDGAGSWAWDLSPANYSGAFNSTNIIGVARNVPVPIRFRDLKGFITRQGKDWVEDNI